MNHEGHEVHEEGDLKTLTRAGGLLVERTLNDMRESGSLPEELKRQAKARSHGACCARPGNPQAEPS